MANYFIDFEFIVRSYGSLNVSKFGNCAVSANYQKWDLTKDDLLGSLQETLKEKVVDTFPEVSHKDEIQNLRIRCINKL